MRELMTRSWQTSQHIALQRSWHALNMQQPQTVYKYSACLTSDCLQCMHANTCAPSCIDTSKCTFVHGVQNWVSGTRLNVHLSAVEDLLEQCMNDALIGSTARLYEH